MTQRRAVLCGYYGMGNGGDEALLATLLEMLPPSVEPVVLSGDPERTQQQYGVAAVPRKSPTAVLRVLRQSEVFIWGGGSLMQDATSALNPLYYGGLMGIAQQLGLTTIAWAQGIGPLHRSISRWIARECFCGCDLATVRDRNSAVLLREWNVPCTLAPDPVWALDSKPPEGIEDLRSPRVAVTLRPHRHLTPARLETLTRALSDFQTATETTLLLVPFQPCQDLKLAETLRDRLGRETYIWHSDDPRQLKGVFRRVEFAIGMRLHGLIAAAAEGCRCWALDYDPKVSQLMAELDLPGWKLEALPDDANPIGRAWIDFYANGEPVNPVRVQALADRALTHRDRLHERLS
ncbi:MAG: polysaccharide pyruvyl transferase CsaB [Cyanobacteria bacterium SID2]|nr:polysaccharide pyruvyl transferase CsaB [Cyanobacteria bacterium SID2]MBP0004430.1 polysaccharide pyruvyl transferase CsaB [Cyanobacteria bacterium SBC]